MKKLLLGLLVLGSLNAMASDGYLRFKCQFEGAKEGWTSEANIIYATHSGKREKQYVSQVRGETLDIRRSTCLQLSNALSTKFISFDLENRFNFSCAYEQLMLNSWRTKKNGKLKRNEDVMIADLGYITKDEYATNGVDYCNLYADQLNKAIPILLSK